MNTNEMNANKVALKLRSEEELRKMVGGGELLIPDEEDDEPEVSIELAGGKSNEAELPKDQNSKIEKAENQDDDWGEEEDDLLTFKDDIRQPVLKEGEYLAKITNVTGEKRRNSDGREWVNTKILFEIDHAGSRVLVPFWAGMSLNESGRLYPIVEGILGMPPKPGMSLKMLQGRTTAVTIGHHKDAKGNVWEEIRSTRKA